MKKMKITGLLVITLLLTFNCTPKESIVSLETTPVSNDNTVFEKVDQMPEFDGGMSNFMNYLQKNLKYPEQAKRTGTEGKVFVEFVVGKDGSISNVKVLKGIGAGCDEEALRVINNSPDWQPGIKEGYFVNVKLVVPISFKLS